MTSKKEKLKYFSEGYYRGISDLSEVIERQMYNFKSDVAIANNDRYFMDIIDNLDAAKPMKRQKTLRKIIE